MSAAVKDRRASELDDLASDHVSERAPLLLSQEGDATPADGVSDAGRSLRWKGVVCAVFCVCNDIAQSEYTQWAYGDVQFSSYLFLTWFTTVVLTLALPLGLLCHWLWLVARRDDRRRWVNYKALLQNELFTGPKLSPWTYAWGGALTMLLNFVSSYFWWLSLGLLPVGLNFALSHSEVIVVLLLSRVFLKERLSIARGVAFLGLAAALLLVFFGKAKHSDFSSGSITLGIFYVLGAVLTWGFYDVSYKKIFGEPTVFVLLAAQSAIGLSAALGGAAALPLAWHFGLEPVVDTSSSVILAFLLVSAGFSGTYFVAYSAALVATSPVWVSFIDLLDIPLSAVCDFLLWGTTYPAISVIGMSMTVVVLVAFNAYELGFWPQAWKRPAACCRHSKEPNNVP